MQSSSYINHMNKCEEITYLS